MAVLKAFVCQIILLGLYKLFLEQVVEEHLVPDEVTRNCLVGFVCLLCFGIQLSTEKVEEQTRHGKAKSRRRSSAEAAENVSEYLDARTAHMMRTLDAAMQHMNQVDMSGGYVQNVIFAAAGPEAAVFEQTFAKQPDVMVVEEVYMTKLSEKSDIFANEPVVKPVKIEEVTEMKRSDRREEEEREEEVEEESETKSDVCEEEEEDVVTVIDASKAEVKTKPEAMESEEEEEDEEPVVVKKNVKIVEKPTKVPSEDEEEEEEEEEDEEEEEPVVVEKKNEKIVEKPVKKISEDEEEEEEEEESDEEEVEEKQYVRKVTKTS